MNVLLITFSFPPAGGVGVLRALSLAKYLPENDIRVDVLTARNAPAVGKDASLLQQVPASVTVHRSWTLDLPFWLRKAVKKGVSDGGAKAGSTAGATAKKNGGSPLKRLIGNLLLPDPQVGWLPFAFPAARRIIRERKIDIVLITVPPFSSVRLATRLRKVFPSLPIVVDFRDEWLTTTIDLVSFNNNDRARMVAHKAEAEAVRDATAVVAVTEAARNELRGRYPGVPAEKFRCIPNGYDGPVPTAAADPGSAAPGSSEQRTTLTYIGTVYGSTDPGTFIQAVQGLPEQVRSRLRIRFIGHIETPAYRAALMSLGDTIELKGFVPQAEALRAIQDTTYLLLITHDRINVAAKLYDYLGGGKPILGAVHRDGDVRRLLEETGAGWWADIDDVEAIRRVLIEAVERQGRLGEAFQPDLESIASYHRRPLAQRYAALLRETARQRP
ncbi:MAG: glycosyl transferase group 1 [Edaphobacter sp.]|nr:glycosyl transferase group 1 [Edaphobacter sp.]